MAWFLRRNRESMQHTVVAPGRERTSVVARISAPPSPTPTSSTGAHIETSNVPKLNLTMMAPVREDVNAHVQKDDAQEDCQGARGGEQTREQNWRLDQPSCHLVQVLEEAPSTKVVSAPATPRDSVYCRRPRTPRDSISRCHLPPNICNLESSNWLSHRQFEASKLQIFHAQMSAPNGLLQPASHWLDASQEPHSTSRNTSILSAGVMESDVSGGDDPAERSPRSRGHELPRRRDSFQRQQSRFGVEEGRDGQPCLAYARMKAEEADAFGLTPDPEGNLLLTETDSDAIIYMRMANALSRLRPSPMPAGNFMTT
jgi:hypothetical protein